ncbi:MAG: TetR/AcrR family transcriptional regulator, partial [Clostridia bacterium]|nr:TetR/AcrR family transcriptional regulator [Clostridia bacterium]
PEIFKLLFDMTSMSLWKASFNDQLRDMFSDLSSVIETEISNVPPSEANVDGYSPKVLARRVVSALFGTAMQAVLDPDEKNVRASLSALQISFE